jgi:hypothetical protein
VASLFEYLCGKNVVTFNSVNSIKRPNPDSGEGKPAPAPLSLFMFWARGPKTENFSQDLENLCRSLQRLTTWRRITAAAVLLANKIPSGPVY